MPSPLPMVSVPPSKYTELRNHTQDAFHRLVKSISGRNESTTSSPTLVAQSPELPASSEELPQSSSSGIALQRVISSSSSQTKQKKRSKIADRLKRIGQDLGNLKFRQSDSKSVPASPRVSVGDIQPQITNTSTISHPNNSAPHAGHAKLLSMVAEVEEPTLPVLPSNSSELPVATSSSAVEPVEGTTLAQRIQTLIDSLPFPITNTDKKIPIPKNPKPTARGPDGRPIPPPNSSPVKDSKLLGFLSSPTIMNGSTLKGKPSIWSMLDAFGPPPHGYPPTEDETSNPRRSEDTPSNGNEPGDQDTIFSDNSSVMIYSPLIPTNDDLVELAELVPVGVEQEPATGTQPPLTGTSWTTMWPLSLWYGESPSGDKAPPVTSLRRSSGETVISPRRTSIDITGHAVRTQTVRAWVPSNSKLSLQAMWWGYRLYLPPPVLAILSDKTLEATKRASMITSALTWFFNNLPVDTLPPAVRPAALLLQRLVPFLGYIGTFISWSWSTIKGYDIGFGVILTATWLLPIALIPGTWHQNEFPMSPTQPAPAPLPPISPPPSDTPSLPASSTPTSPTLTYTSLPTTTPGSPAAFSYFTSSPGPQSPPSLAGSSSMNTSYYTRIVVDIPVPATSPEPIPIPPTPPQVPLGSPLMEQLLHGPMIPTVPLPDEDAPTPYLVKTKKDSRNRAKALFKRSSKSR